MSKTTTVIRVPNAVLPQVRQIIKAYRKKILLEELEKLNQEDLGEEVA